VAVSRSALLPLFRSETQVRILTELYCGRDDELMIAELAERIRLPLSSVSREVHRLQEDDILHVRKRGRAQFASPNRDAPWSRPLTELLDRTTGPAAVIAATFGVIPNLEAVWIFGSWAARSRGQRGAAPHDIDVVVVGAASTLEVSRAAASAERRIGIPVSAISIERTDWDQPQPDSFVASIKMGPLVEVITRGSAHD
jgi:DNA-binding transcriptional ArsR family regulator